jgi:transaldolase
MPEPVIHAFADHGEIGGGDTVTGAYEAARKVFADLTAVGIDLDDVSETLEREGVEKFEASYIELLEGVEKTLKAAAKGSDNPNDAAKGNAAAAERAGGNA